jgi:hypothetical protein
MPREALLESQLDDKSLSASARDYFRRVLEDRRQSSTEVGPKHMSVTRCC